ncbi:translation initiation factor IF-2-like [Schistocerca piceifrons]|uniref:translation initiation factor IF-2-like n=1 Tax=Schistocerca piceifrons TaxID=274613 RepID=UPI001F5FC863|nr:translation initiation factor IF-2-like [Schistocerca piceifrons]
MRRETRSSPPPAASPQYWRWWLAWPARLVTRLTAPAPAPAPAAGSAARARAPAAAAAAAAAAATAAASGQQYGSGAGSSFPAPRRAAPRLPSRDRSGPGQAPDPHACSPGRLATAPVRARTRYQAATDECREQVAKDRGNWVTQRGEGVERCFVKAKFALSATPSGYHGPVLKTETSQNLLLAAQTRLSLAPLEVTFPAGGFSRSAASQPGDGGQRRSAVAR